MDNPKYEHDNGSQQNSTINNGNLQLNYGTGNNDVILAVDDAELSKITSNQNKIFIQHTKGTFLKNPTNFTKRKLFILQWIFIYSSEDFLGDLLAGITIGLTVIPQSMALASIVGIPAQAFSTTRIGPKEEELQTAWQKNVNKLIWAIGAFRNSFVVIVCSIICYCCVHKTNHDITSDWAPPIPFKVIGKIPYGLPHFQWPEFSNSNESFLDIILFMGSGIIVIPLISLLENISLCRTFAEGKPIDTDQELLAIGMANIGNSFFQGFAGSGAIARGALNYSSGVRTPLGGLYTGLTVMAALLFLTPYFYYIPKTSLAAVIIAASFMMVDVKMVKYVYNSKKKDLVLMLITFFSCLFLPLEYGVLIGIVANVGFIMCSAAKPKISIQVQKNCDGIKYLLLTPDRYLIFPSMEYVRQTITKHGLALGIPVVIDGSSIFEADFTTANVFSMMSLDFSKKGQYLYLYNLKPSVASVFKGIKNCNIYLCANKDELNELLRNHFGPSQIQEQYQNETIWTSKM
ncbi:sodium-independent sulfate anion transporter-like isoform X2 [Aphis gossypii]|uniref:sodium-independent sulfate anion transporter-like isoform X2 n=1 Tax=Aphis gossypii TaxID=80765 RepID=UPI002159529D|nr:sodium-independent sulfate anion transporter-like isoform X2 [Aphis gossypii]